MPLYRYRCEYCSQELEVLAKVSDPAPITCESCGKDGLRKVIGRTGFRLAGGGWYAQGYDGASNNSGGSGGASPSSDD